MEINEKIIEFVRKNKSLFDLRDKYYRNTTYKMRLWEKIALELNMTSAAVKTKWKILRDGYMKYKKQVQGNTGSERRNITYVWAEQLSFLDDILRPRSTTSNITASIQQPQPSFASTSLEDYEITDLPMESYPTSTDVIFPSPLTADTPTPLPAGIYAPSTPLARGGTISTPILSPTSTYTPSSTTPLVTTAQYPRQNQNDAPTPLPAGTYAPSTPLARGATISTPIPSPTSTYTPSSTTPLVTTAQYPRQKQNESDIDKALNYLRNKKKEVYDGTDLLFLSYASTFKKLSLLKQAELKVKLAQLFAEAEVSELSSQRNSAPQVAPQVQQYLLPAYSNISLDSEHEVAARTSGENSGLQHLPEDLSINFEYQDGD